jgi:FMN phosphatase YigB (HAD superfamily)
MLTATQISQVEDKVTKMPMDEPTLVVFDLDNTLYDYEPCNRLATTALIELAVNETNLSRRQVEEAYHKAKIEVKGRTGDTASSHSRILYVNEMLFRLGFAENVKLALSLEGAFWSTFLSHMTLGSGAVDLLSALRLQGIPVAVVSDMTLQLQLRKLLVLGVDPFVDVLVTSEEAGAEKPSLAPFRLLSQRLPKQHFANVWMVGDEDHDLPIERLREEAILIGGVGWIKGRKRTSSTAVPWSSLTEIQRALTRVNVREGE